MFLRLTATISLVALTGCASQPPEWLTGSKCFTINCDRNLEFYPNSQYTTDQVKNFHNWEYGKTSSAYHPSDPKYQELKEQEIQQGNTPWHYQNKK